MKYIRTINLEMLNLMGSIYVIEHVIAEYEIESEEKFYKTYITDLLKTLAEINNITVSGRFIDLLNISPEPEKTGDEIAKDIIERAGLKVK